MELEICRIAPSDWLRIAISEVCTKFTSGGTPSRSQAEFYLNGDVPWVKTKELNDNNIDSTEEHITEYAIKASSAKFLPAGTILMAMYGATVGQLGKISRTMACNQACAAMVVNTTRAYPDYLFYQLLLHRNQIKSLATGAAQQNLSGTQIKEFILPFPNIKIQKGIGQTLRILDDKIALNHRMNEVLEAIARSFFKDWFIDFGPTHAKIKESPPYLSPHLWHIFPRTFNSNGLPQGWKKGLLQEIVEINPTEPISKDTTMPYLDMAALPISGPLAEYPVQRQFTSGMRFRNGDTLLARITPCLENGKTAFVQSLSETSVGWGSTEFIVLRSRPPVPKPYSYLLARDPAFRMHAIQSMTGTSGRQRARNEAIATYPVSCPSNEVWSAFASIVNPIFERIKSNGTETHTLAQTRDLLLPKLMSGEIRIRDAEKIVEQAL